MQALAKIPQEAFLGYLHRTVQNVTSIVKKTKALSKIIMLKELEDKR